MNPYQSATGCRTPGQIQAFAFARPSNSVIGSNGELLIYIASRASIDLHLVAIGCGSGCDVETFVAIDLQRAADVCPCLSCLGGISLKMKKRWAIAYRSSK